MFSMPAGSCGFAYVILIASLMRAIMANFNQTGAAVAVAGGLLRIAASFAPVVIASESSRELLYVVVDLCLIAGLLAFYVSRRANLRWPGTCGFVAALAGLAVVRANRAVSPVDLYPVGSITIVCGLIVLTLASWRAERSPGWVPLAFVASLILGVLGSAVPRVSVLFVVSGVVFGTAFAGAGWTIWSDARRPARTVQFN